MTTKKLAKFYKRSSDRINFGVEYIKPIFDYPDEVKVWLTGREAYYVLIHRIIDTWHLRLFRLKDGEGIFIDNYDYGICNDPPYPTLKQVKVFIENSIGSYQLALNERIDMQLKSYDVIRNEIEKALEAKGWRQTESVKRFSMYVRDSGTLFYSSIIISSEEGEIVLDICDKETGYRTITKCHFDYMVFKEDVIKMNIPTIKLEIKL